MTFHSILFRGSDHRPHNTQRAEPEFFVDLGLDQIVAAVTAGKDEYDLTPFFHAPLHDPDAIAYRQEIMRALEDVRVFDAIQSFAVSMHEMREHLSQAKKLHYKNQKDRWLLDAVEIYCDAVTTLSQWLAGAKITAPGLLALRDYMTQYTASVRFISLLQQAKRLVSDLASIHYCVHIQGLRVNVRKYEGESDYSADVLATFERFKQGAVKQHGFKFIELPDMNHIEANVLELVTRVYPDRFAQLRDYCARNQDFPDPTIVRFDREVQFYISYLGHIASLKKAGLQFCYPRLLERCKGICNRRGFDLALAGKLIGNGEVPVCNDFYFENRERIIVVSGPNQGGKTTFARTFGQLHYLACLGCAVPGTEARLFLFDRMFTHFERQENIRNLRGKLQEDLVRIHHILEQATPNSIIIMNEIFTSTTLRDAIVLSNKIAAKIMELDLLCVWVTFVDELARLSAQTVSMVSTVVPDNPAQRTYKVVRRPADGLSYAMSIAEKYRLTYDLIRERIGS